MQNFSANKKTGLRTFTAGLHRKKRTKVWVHALLKTCAQNCGTFNRTRSGFRQPSPPVPEADDVSGSFLFKRLAWKQKHTGWVPGTDLWPFPTHFRALTFWSPSAGIQWAHTLAHLKGDVLFFTTASSNVFSSCFLWKDRFHQGLPTCQLSLAAEIKHQTLRFIIQPQLAQWGLLNKTIPFLSNIFYYL